jgi:AraC-like DNA-binding protein
MLSDKQLRRARHRIETERLSIARVAGEMGVPKWTLARSLRRQASRAA